MRTPAAFAVRTAPKACSRSASLACFDSAKRPPSVEAKPTTLSSTPSVGTSANAIADPKVQPVRRSDVASGEDAHARERAGRVVATREQLRFGIAEAGEPVRATQTGEVRVAIDEPGNDRGARCVDSVGISRIRRAVARTEVRDPAIAHEQGHPALEGGRAPVGEGRPAQERPG